MTDGVDRRFEVVGSSVTHDGLMSRVRVDRVCMPDGDAVEREVVEHLDAVAVVPLTDDGHVVMVRQFRHPTRSYQLEIPAGLLDVEGEDPAAAAQRELAEEVGLVADRLERLTCFWNSAGWTDEATTVYLGTALRDVEPGDDFEAVAEEADMQVVRLALTDAIAKVADGEIADAKTVVGLLLAARHTG